MTVFRGKFFQILWASLPNSTDHRGTFSIYIYIVINGLRTRTNMTHLLPATAIGTVCLPNKLV